MHLSCVFYQHLNDFKDPLNLIAEVLGFDQLEKCALFVSMLLLLVTLYLTRGKRKVYLVDFACYKPETTHKISKQVAMDVIAGTGYYTQENVEFQRKLIERSGFGEGTYVPASLTSKPANACMEGARKEAEMLMFGAVDELLAKTRVKKEEIGIVIVNCSLFNPIPSLTSMVVNHYKLRENVKGFSLGGMGCSAGTISVDLAKHLLQVHHNTYALLVSTEVMTINFYRGNNRSMLVPNSLFRMGASAALLSNNPSDRPHSKYQLIHTVRSHKGANDKSYSCVYQKEDEEGLLGLSLSKDLMAVAGESLKTNITALGPLVLPISEQIKYLVSFVARRVLHMQIKPYVPDFKTAFEHFCVHAGGRAVLDEVEKSLKLSKWDMEPSRKTLYKFGNTSSSSLWYQLAYSEAKGRMIKGDRVWQIGFGSGFKCNSIVWRALRTIHPVEDENAWTDEIDQFSG